MSIFKCKMCGGTIEFEQGPTVGVCDSCGTKQTLPRLDDDKKANLYDRANHFRRNNDFDKAMGIYEQILNEDNTDAEAYWSLVLCRYGIEYVEDPSSHKRIPTVNRAQFTSIYMDEDYKSALQYADGYQKQIYEDEAKAIDDIQKGILEISSKEEPFDVFICYKETDVGGRRTQDSVLAAELFHELTREGFKVFFSRITLEDKLGQEYEPYIFAALNSAKVMVVLGTKPEYFNAVWVKNEWSRYLALIKNGAKKMLIPAYRDMDPYDLPEEFSHLQAQDMSKLGFMQDLTRGIKKIVEASASKATAKETVIAPVANANIAPLLKRAFMFLEDGEFDRADDFCEQVLNQDPECAEAYLGKLMAELHVKKRSELADCAEPFDERNNFRKAARFGNAKLSAELKGYILHINERNENTRLTKIYNNAVNKMQLAVNEEAYIDASKTFKSIAGFKDADTLSEQCLEKAEICRKNVIYDNACKTMNTKPIFGNGVVMYERALKIFQAIPGWKDADDKIILCQQEIAKIRAKEEADRLEAKRQAEKKRIAAEKAIKRAKKIAAIVITIVCVVIAFAFVYNTVIIPNSKYNDALVLMNDGKYEEAIISFEALEGYKDSNDKIADCETAIKDIAYNNAVALMNDGKYEEAIAAFSSLSNYKDALEKRAICVINIYGQETLCAGGSHTVGLKSDGKVIAVGSNGYGQCNASEWKDIVAVSVGYYHTVGLKSDGTVVAVGSNGNGQCNVSNWKDIVAVSAGYYHTVGLKSDGTVVAVGSNSNGKCDVSSWKDIVAVSAGNSHTVGLKSDGTVVAVGSNEYGRCDVSNWKDIIAVYAGSGHTVGLKSDGTVVAVGSNGYGQCDVSSWKDIVEISAGDYHTVGLKSDGTVVAVGSNTFAQCDVSSWEDIVAVSAGNSHTVGMKSDGTVVAVGSNGYGKCDVSYWSDILLPQHGALRSGMQINLEP